MFFRLLCIHFGSSISRSLYRIDLHKGPTVWCVRITREDLYRIKKNEIGIYCAAAEPGIQRLRSWWCCPCFCLGRPAADRSVLHPAHLYIYLLLHVDILIPSVVANWKTLLETKSCGCVCLYIYICEILSPTPDVRSMLDRRREQQK